MSCQLELSEIAKTKFRIVERRDLCPKVTLYRIYAPAIATARRAGQFVIVRPVEGSERIPLTIADANPDEGTITLVVQEVGATTARMARMGVGETFTDVVGPLGSPTHIEKFGLVVCIGGGIGIAPVHPIAQTMKAMGNKVISILAARNTSLLFFREEMRAASDEVRIWTDDGSEGKKGLATHALQEIFEEYGRVDQAVAIGPVPMMKFVSLTAKQLGIPIQVSLNPIMVDGTGMCGGCRVTVGGKSKFVCVDGPEFDGYQVDFDEMVRRSSLYRDQEAASLEHLTKEVTP